VNSYAYEAGIEDGVHLAGEPQLFRVQAVDNRVPPVNKGTGGDNFIFVVRGGEGREVRGSVGDGCTDYNIGIYYCAYTYGVAEDVTIYVQLKGIDDLENFHDIQGGTNRVISDCHFSVQLNHVIPVFLSYSVAVFLK
jgi:hypothetical protein